jgi:hypothetical protein
VIGQGAPWPEQLSGSVIWSRKLRRERTKKSSPGGDVADGTAITWLITRSPST